MDSCNDILAITRTCGTRCTPGPWRQSREVSRRHRPEFRGHGKKRKEYHLLVRIPNRVENIELLLLFVLVLTFFSNLCTSDIGKHFSLSNWQRKNKSSKQITLGAGEVREMATWMRTNVRSGIQSYHLIKTFAIWITLVRNGWATSE